MRFDLPTFEDPTLVAPAYGAPMQLPIADIDEDPDQPRREFDEAALNELAATIAERGVRQPVSVRPHPRQPGRWLLNFGARRLRASKLVGKNVLPAFVDPQFDSYDQVIENEQREPLRPLELALFVQRQLAAGESQAEIARRLGKSRAHITCVCALVDAPDWLLTLYREGRCRGIKELYDLRRLHAEHGAKVLDWAVAANDITRAGIASYRNALTKNGGDPSMDLASSALSVRPSATQFAARPISAAPPPTGEGRTAEQLQVLAVCDGAEVQVVLNELPREEGKVYVTLAGRARRKVVPIASLDNVRLGRQPLDQVQESALLARRPG